MRDLAIVVLTATVTIATLVAALFWLWSSLVTVPDNIDTFVPALQKIGRLNAIGAAAASLAAICALILWLLPSAPPS